MKRILIVEDDKFLASALEAKLFKDGFIVEAIGDGADVIGTLSKYTPDMILLDLMMPKMDGFAVLEQMKKNDTLKSVPVIVITNLSQTEDADKARELGAIDYLIKSDMTLQTLVERVKKYL
jgi:DNA-binding response OmpR family regulator